MGADQDLEQRMVDVLRQTRPFLWVCALGLALGAVAAVLVGFVLGVPWVGAMAGMVAAVLAGLLCRQALALARLDVGHRLVAVTDALDADQAFWRVGGALVLLGLVVGAGAMIALWE